MLFADRALETSTTTGTGNITLAGAVAGHATWAAQHTVGEVVYYAIVAVDANGNPTGEQEVGLGIYLTSTTFSRAIVTESSNADALVNFSAGTKWCFTTAHSKWFRDRNYKRVMRAVPTSASATLTTLGLAVTGTGTATLFTQTNASLLTQQARIDYLVTVAAATAVAGFRIGGLPVWRGNAAGLGGFHLVLRAGNATGAVTATSRGFFGMQSNTSAPTDVEPSSLLNMLGIGWGAADTNVQLMTNDGAGTATKVDLGASFPVPTVDRGNIYELELWCAPNDTKINYIVKNIANNAVAIGIVSADLPANTVFLAPRGYISVGGTSSVIGCALMELQLSSDY